MKKYQFVKFFPDWQGIYFGKFDPEKTDLALIYKWIIGLGFWEIRRWSDQALKLKEIDDAKNIQ